MTGISVMCEHSTETYPNSVASVVSYQVMREKVLQHFGDNSDSRQMLI